MLNIQKVKKMFTGLVFVSGMAAASASHALVMTDSASFNYGSWNFSDYHYGSGQSYATTKTRNQNVYLSGFDSSLGNLTGVDISFSSSWSLDTRVSASDTYNNWGKDYTNGQSYASNKMNVDLVNPNGPAGNRNEYESTSCSASSWRNPSCSRVSTSSGSFNGAIDTSALNLMAFIDNTIMLNLKQDLSVRAASSDSDTRVYGWNYNNAWNGVINVAYTYEKVAVSEPASIALLGLGLLALGLRRQRT